MYGPQEPGSPDGWRPVPLHTVANPRRGQGTSVQFRMPWAPLLFASVECSKRTGWDVTGTRPRRDVASNSNSLGSGTRLDRLTFNYFEADGMIVSSTNAEYIVLNSKHFPARDEFLCNWMARHRRRAQRTAPAWREAAAETERHFGKRGRVSVVIRA